MRNAAYELGPSDESAGKARIRSATYSNFYEPPPSAPKSIQPPFDSHFVAVQRGEYQCVDGLRRGVEPDYEELVLKEAHQALPAYRLFFTA